MEPFETYRPWLLGLAYRLLGSMWDAEDVVQEAYARWSAGGRDEMREPRIFLVTAVSRLALDQLRSARGTREAYVGPWLPEPVATEALGPLGTPGLRGTVAYATVHLMEGLSPPERAVFVLRESFEVPYGEIARILDTTVTSCRQLHHRAARRLAAGRDRFTLAADAHARLLTRLLEAARGGDPAGPGDLLTEDVVAWSDGGGKVRAALRPIGGREQVAAFVVDLVTHRPLGAPRLVDVNGRPCLAGMVDGNPRLLTVDVMDGRVDGIHVMLNPDKLAHIPG
ncbi:RNA polymerase sigma factor SigJ [Streptomyces sp. NPDC087903]|uniref:RNA polymerase sigma factor SigJ n=1 Tax=Streptomyces sp. NPDC087903 TaxID=3365819 RepID=UPI0038014803